MNHSTDCRGPHRTEGTRTDPERWLQAGLGLIRVTAPTADAWRGSISLLEVVYSEWGGLPPGGVVADLAWLLRGGKLNTSSAVTPHHAELRRSLRAYDDHVLARLAYDGLLGGAQDAIARLTPNVRTTAIPLVVAMVLGRLDPRPALRLDPGVVRRFVATDPEVSLAAGFDAWRSEADVLSLLARGYEQLASRARRLPSLLAPSDVFLLENIDVLARLGQRVAIGQIVDAADELVQAWPGRVTGKPRKGTARTALEGESAYPAGGFAAISNAGSLENLVSSELIYMDRSGDLDSFDVRYAEGELLYYSRDEGTFARSRRHLYFVLHPSLVRARVKDADVPWQRGIVLLALLLAWTRHLSRWLGDEDLQLRFRFWHEERAAFRLTEEEALVTLTLREWSERGMASVARATPAAIVEQCVKSALSAVTEVVVLADREGWAAWERESSGEGVAAVHLDQEPRSLDEWKDIGLRVLSRLL